jgi:hypothetical protein
MNYLARLSYSWRLSLAAKTAPPPPCAFGPGRFLRKCVEETRRSCCAGRPFVRQPCNIWFWQALYTVLISAHHILLQTLRAGIERASRRGALLLSFYLAAARRQSWPISWVNCKTRHSPEAATPLQIADAVSMVTICVKTGKLALPSRAFV